MIDITKEDIALLSTDVKSIIEFFVKDYIMQEKMVRVMFQIRRLRAVAVKMKERNDKIATENHIRIGPCFKRIWKQSVEARGGIENWLISVIIANGTWNRSEGRDLLDSEEEWNRFI